jgi:hypothetical protein
MHCSTKYIFSVTLFICSLTSTVFASETLSEALQRGRQVAIFNVNDCFTDADSIQAFIESLLLGSMRKEQITQYFVTDDEANRDTVAAVAKRIADKKCFEDDKEAPIREHYLHQVADQEKMGQLGRAYRVQDVALILCPLADRLGISVQVVQGEISTNPTYNPYFGNFGNDYSGEDEQYLRKIHHQTGSKAVIELIRKEMAAGKSIYLLNGGSFRLLSDIQEMAPDLLHQLDVTVMSFRQSMNFPPFSNPGRTWFPSWNEGIDKDATAKCMKFASSAHNPQFGAFRIVDSNTVEYGLVCDGKMLPAYKDYMSRLRTLISVAAYKNLLEAEDRHETWSGFKTKFMDPMFVFNAFGMVSILHRQGKLVEDEKDFCIRPSQEGFPALYPDSDGKHPFSCPRANTAVEEHPDYIEHYRRVAELRAQLKAAHATTWAMVDDIRSNQK